MHEITTNTPKTNLIYINKEQHVFDHIKNAKDLVDYVEKHTKPKVPNAIFIDEVQEIYEFENALKSLNASEQYDIFCSGSNANLLSGELSTYLAGRYIEIEIFPLSFPEFCEFHKLNTNQDTLLKYIKYGGLPYLINLPLEEDIVYDYLKNIYNSILLRDVVSRHNIRNIAFLERLVEFLADNIGSLLSAKRISDFLKSQKINIPPNSILNYLSFLEQAFFISKVQRKDITGKKIFEINDKYYFEDLGLRHAVIDYKQPDIGMILENLVYQHLKISGYDVKVGKMSNLEIDFVCEKPGKKWYIQVAYLISDKKTREREFGNLLQIKDNYKKTVISMDPLIDNDYKGIHHINVLNFLSEIQ